jgi:hypothetical protein
MKTAPSQLEVRRCLQTYLLNDHLLIISYLLQANRARRLTLDIEAPQRLSVSLLQPHPSKR